MLSLHFLSLALLGKGFSCVVKTGFRVRVGGPQSPRVCKNRIFCMHVAHPHTKIAFSCVGWLCRPHVKIKIKIVKKN